MALEMIQSERKRQIKNKITGLTRDEDWISRCFLLPKNTFKSDEYYKKEDYHWMYYSTADSKYTNTSIGGNFSINSPPSFTIFADPPTGLLHSSNSKQVLSGGMGSGMGTYYSEAIDDNAHLVSFRFGMPEYKGLFTFFTGFYNADAALLGTQGRTSTRLFYFAGRVIGTMVSLGLNLIIMAAQVWRLFLNRPHNNYYWVKEAMPLYWSRVQLICNRIAANMGLTPDGSDIRDDKGVNQLRNMGIVEDSAYDTNDEVIRRDASYAFNQVKDYMPELFNDSGGIDIYRVVLKANRMRAASEYALYELGMGAVGTMQFTQAVRRHLSSFNPGGDVSVKNVSLKEYLRLYHESILGATTVQTSDGEIDTVYNDAVSDRINEIASAPRDQAQPVGDGTGTTTPVVDPNADVTNGQQTEGEQPAPEESSLNSNGGGISAPLTGEQAREEIRKYAAQDNRITSILMYNAEEVIQRLESSWLKMTGLSDPASYFMSAFKRGGDWVTFKVDPNQTESESWSNSATEAEIKSTINGISSTVRAARYSFSNFETGFGIIDAPLRMVRDTIAGVLDGVHLSGLLALAGTGQVDIPKRYDNSTFQATQTNYTMELRATYGDPLSIFLDLYVPIACLLAAALPISHGNSAYGAPFLCESYVRGRSATRIGMIDNISITRGAGMLGWNQDGLPLGIDVSFSVVNMNDIMHMPIDTGLTSLYPMDALLQNDTIAQDYLGVLSNLSIADQTHMWRKLKLRWSAYRINVDSYFNAARFGMWVSHNGLVRMLSGFTEPPGVTTL